MTKYYILLLLSLGVAASAGAQPAEVIEVAVVSTVTGSTTPPSTAPKRELAKPGVTLSAIVVARQDGKRVVFSDHTSVVLRGKKHQTLPLSRSPIASFTWFRVEPTIPTMSNTESGSFRFESIPYEETVIATGPSTIRAGVRPTLTPDYGDGLGTMRFKVVAVTSGGRSIPSPGKEARRGRGSGGLRDEVHRVSLRSDDSYLGFLSEFYGQPYIWASGGSRPSVHQTERLEGSDCADFITYGWRRLGSRIPYTWSEGLRAYTRNLGAGSPDQSGLYRDRRGEVLPFQSLEIFVLFPRHVGALVEDRGTLGVLDAEDLMFHTLFDSPRVQPLGDTTFGRGPLELLRWSRHAAN